MTVRFLGCNNGKARTILLSPFWRIINPRKWVDESWDQTVNINELWAKWQENQKLQSRSLDSDAR